MESDSGLGSMHTRIIAWIIAETAIKVCTKLEHGILVPAG